MAELLPNNTGVGAVSVSGSGGGFNNLFSTLVNGYLAGEIVKKSNPQTAQYAEYGVITQADRAQTMQPIGTVQRVNTGINPMFLVGGGLALVALIFWMKK